MKKIVSFMLSLILLLSLTPLCLAEDAWAERALYEGIDVSEPEVINVYFVGFESADWERIDKLVNEKLAAKINTTINFVHVSFADFISSYSLYLTGGTDVDLDLLHDT